MYVYVCVFIIMTNDHTSSVPNMQGSYNVRNIIIIYNSIVYIYTYIKNINFIFQMIPSQRG